MRVSAPRRARYIEALAETGCLRCSGRRAGAVHLAAPASPFVYAAGRWPIFAHQVADALALGLPRRGCRGPKPGLPTPLRDSPAAVPAGFPLGGSRLRTPGPTGWAVPGGPAGAEVAPAGQGGARCGDPEAVPVEAPGDVPSEEAEDLAVLAPPAGVSPPSRAPAAEGGATGRPCPCQARLKRAVSLVPRPPTHMKHEPLTADRWTQFLDGIRPTATSAARPRTPRPSSESLDRR